MTARFLPPPWVMSLTKIVTAAGLPAVTVGLPFLWPYFFTLNGIISTKPIETWLILTQSVYFRPGIN
eukprot:11730222-Ditylum_brightwellii.AAC.1